MEWVWERTYEAIRQQNSIVARNGDDKRAGSCSVRTQTNRRAQVEAAKIGHQYSTADEVPPESSSRSDHACVLRLSRHAAVWQIFT